MNSYITLVTDKTTKNIPIDINPEPLSRMRWTAFSALPPLKHSLSDKFQNREQRTIGFCVPLFHTNLHSPENWKEITLSCYIKRAFWLAYELSIHAGLKDLSNFYILTDSEMREALEPYRLLCGFPEDHIIEVADVHQTCKWYMAKVVLLKCFVEQTNYTHYMHLDTSLFLPVTVDFCEPLEAYWETSPDNFIFYTEPWAKAPAVKPLEARYMTSKRALEHVNTPEALYRFYTEMPKFFDKMFYEEYLEEVMSFPIIGQCLGALLGVPRHAICSDNFDKLLQFAREKQCIYSDETFWATYWHKYLSPATEIYTQPEFLKQATQLTIWDIQSDTQFPDGYFYHLHRQVERNPQFMNFFLEHYRNL